jgi:hypothetical protein
MKIGGVNHARGCATEWSKTRRPRVMTSGPQNCSPRGRAARAAERSVFLPVTVGRFCLLATGVIPQLVLQDYGSRKEIEHYEVR